jgi:hypothetical protein
MYEDIALNYLLPSVTQFRIPHYLFVVEDMGTWAKNVSILPSIIWKAMKTFPNDNIVWMDIDTLIRYEPTLFNHIPGRCDVGLYYMKYEDHYALGVPPGVSMPVPELSTSVMYFKNSERMLQLVEEWMKRSSKPGVNHRQQLAHLVNEQLNEDLSFFILPRSYAYLVEREDGSLPAVTMKDPVICHFGAGVYARENLYNAKPFLGGEHHAS